MINADPNIPTMNARFEEAPAEERTPPLLEHTLKSTPGSGERQVCAQMYIQLTAFLTFLRDCKHMDPRSRNFCVSSTFLPAKRSAGKVCGAAIAGDIGGAGAQRGTSETDSGNFLLGVTPRMWF